MSLLGFLLTVAFSAGLAVLFCWLLKVSLTPLAYVGAGLFGYHFGTWLFGALGIRDLLVLNIDSASYPLLAAAVGILATCALARFVGPVR